MHILIIHLSEASRILLTTPILRRLKVKYPSATIELLSTNDSLKLIENNPYLDNCHEFNGVSKQLIKSLRGVGFDCILDLENSISSRFLSIALATKTYRLTRESLLTRMTNKLLDRTKPQKHLVDQYMQLLEPLKIEDDEAGIEFIINDFDEVENDWLPEAFRKEFAVLMLDAPFATRQLPVKRIIELCDKINKPVLLLGHQNQWDNAEEVSTFFSKSTTHPEFESGLTSLGKKTIIFNGCGKFSFGQMASLLSQSRWVFSYDSVWLQIGAAFKKPIFTIWGNTSPDHGGYPYRTRFIIFEVKNLACRPCTKGGFSSCPKGHFKCMNQVAFDIDLWSN